MFFNVWTVKLYLLLTHLRDVHQILMKHQPGSDKGNMFLTIRGLIVRNVKCEIFHVTFSLKCLKNNNLLIFCRIDNRENRNFIMFSREWITDQLLLI